MYKFLSKFFLNIFFICLIFSSLQSSHFFFFFFFLIINLFAYQEQRQATKENVQRKQARTVGEREESDNEASESDSDDEDDNDVIYNPKNLPLGWDGKVFVFVVILTKLKY